MPVLVENERGRRDEDPDASDERTGAVDPELLEPAPPKVSAAGRGKEGTYIWSVKRGKAAPTAERTIVLAARAEAEYIR